MGTSGRAITSMPPGYHSTCVYDTYVPLVYFQYLRSLLGMTAQPLCITTIVSGLQGGGSQRAERVRVGERGCYDDCAIDVVLHRLDSGKRAVAASSPRRSARPTISFNVKAFSIVGRGEGVSTSAHPFPLLSSPLPADTCLMLVYLLLLLAGLTSAQSFVPVAVPLAVRSPHFNIWYDRASRGGAPLSGSWPLFWSTVRKLVFATMNRP